MVVTVLLSGGVDSLIAAYILREQKHDVVGLHLRLGYNDLSEENIRQLSKALDIPVEMADCQKRFQAAVVDYFADAYLRGETPNPCLWCNPRIKFGIGWEYAQQWDTERIASGHYCRIALTADGPRLQKGVDEQKEQSYFLGLLDRSQLPRLCFPVGGMTKTQVRQLARKAGLSPIMKKESQDICFIHPAQTYTEFLEEQGRPVPAAGVIEDIHGNVLGEHPGIQFFTVGQRRGINCPAERPYYVAAIDAVDNKIKVGFREDLLTRRCAVRQMNWLIQCQDEPFSIKVKVRYRHPAVGAVATPVGKDRCQLEFLTPQFGIAPGQGAVLYDGDTVAAGGIIDK